MKKKVTYIIIQLALVFSTCHAQGFKKNEVKMNKEIKELVKLGKDSIIRLALPLIDDKVSLENFTRTSVQTNGNEIYVVFSNPIMYLPINTIFYDNVGVNLTTNTAFKNKAANPIDFITEKGIPYYVQTESIKKKIEFVIGAIISFDTADIVNFRGKMRILEKEDHYDISVLSEMQESWYKIKTTGEIYDEGHAHLVPEPYIENGKGTFKEIIFPEKDK
ncbi:hypothetical protein [Costertonia aggregata]|uniref:DUF4292 domain-containing protein n=1 Tax=Costertonia aggregata TaxID=343403 RepID=A0A7H9AT46_9FLAO|nr:hypothetical protein [Costertonia aggregata]QLG46624.1 hypothetical protein HYG79_15115 [Costertonia aggregata]